ncbi:hypothetical protein J6590_097702 [Homalodisca vitripennis]|nr:hypothetical protein J6590_097702 [Homalodisca vitripennis]
MFEFLQTLTRGQIARGCTGGRPHPWRYSLRPTQVRKNLSRRRNTADVDHQDGTEPATSVVYFNEQYQSETYSSDSEIVALPAFEHIGYAVGSLEEDKPEASITAMDGSIERS